MPRAVVASNPGLRQSLLAVTSSGQKHACVKALSWDDVGMAATGVRRETAGRYLRAAGLAVRRRSGAEPGEAKAATQVSTDTAAEPRPSRSPQASACEPYREWLTEGVAAGRTAMVLWQDLVDDHGFASSYASVKRFAIKLRREASREAHPVIETSRARKRRWTTATGRWCAIPRRASTAARGCSC